MKIAQIENCGQCVLKEKVPMTNVFACKITKKTLLMNDLNLTTPKNCPLIDMIELFPIRQSKAAVKKKPKKGDK